MGYVVQPSKTKQGKNNEDENKDRRYVVEYMSRRNGRWEDLGHTRTENQRKGNIWSSSSEDEGED